MKKICLLLSVVFSCMLMCAVELSWLFCYDFELTGVAIPFDTLVIGAVRDGANSTVTGPWKHEDGTISISSVPEDGDIYIGYSGNLVRLKTLSYPADDPEASLGFAYGDSKIDLTGFEDSLFYIEVMAEGRIVGYTELSTYEDLRPAFRRDEYGQFRTDFETWTPTAHAVPEPSSGLLLLIGGGLLGLRRKKRQVA